MSRLGVADLGVAGLSDMKANAEMIANLDPLVPLIADADTGYGGVCVSSTCALSEFLRVLVQILLLMVRKGR